MRKVLCVNKHRMVMVVPDLLLCECSSYGRLSNLKGATEEARLLVDRQGGLQALRDRIETEEAQRTNALKSRRLKSA